MKNFLKTNEWKVTHKDKPVETIPFERTSSQTTRFDSDHEECVHCKEKFTDIRKPVFIELYCYKPICTSCFKDFRKCSTCGHFVPKRWLCGDKNNNCLLCGKD